jgi:hypothetical protein
MCFGREMPNTDTKNEVLKKSESFKYLGSIVSAEGVCDKDIETRIAMGKQATRALHGLIWNHNTTQKTNKNIPQHSRKQFYMEHKCGRKQQKYGIKLERWSYII